MGPVMICQSSVPCLNVVISKKLGPSIRGLSEQILGKFPIRVACNMHISGVPTVLRTFGGIHVYYSARLSLTAEEAFIQTHKAAAPLLALLSAQPRVKSTLGNIL